MPETDTWTAADDEYVRQALSSLRTDVEALPLADVRFVKARGTARRRRTMLGWTAGAAAVLVAAVVGFSALGGDNAGQPVPPATKTTTPVDRQAVSPYLAEPGALPLGKEWKLALGWSSDFDVQATKNAEADLCWANMSARLNITDIGDQQEDQNVLSRNGNIEGRQTRWNVTRNSAERVATWQADSIAGCKPGVGDFAMKGVQTTGWPRLYSYTAGNAGSGWYAVALAANHVTVLNVVEPDHPKTEFTRAEVERLAAIATERLEQYGGGTATPSASTPSATAPSSGADMPVVGSEPALPSSLFVPASKWSSPELTKGVRTSAGPGSQEGSASIASCETDQFQAGVGGRYGIVSVRAGSAQANYIGKQRVRLDDSASSAQQQAFVQTRLGEAKALYGKGCTFGNGTVNATPGPTDGTWRLDTVFKDGTPTFTEWVGVTAQQTPGAMTTIVLTKVPDPKMGFRELDRLLSLARQR